MAPQVVIGTGMLGTNFCDYTDTPTIVSFLEAVKQNGITRLDTAARYPPGNFGYAETLLGDAGVLNDDQFIIDTKVLTTNIMDGSGDLTQQAMEDSVGASLGRLKKEKVAVLYAHTADSKTPVEEQVTSFNEQLRKGRCEEYGLCNHSVAQVRAILEACDKLGLQKPSVYQGEYNIITRGVEAELLPLLRENNMRHFAYRPLASGFLSGKAIVGEASGTRLGKDSALAGAYSTVYGSEILRDAVKDFVAALKRYELSSLEVAQRWLFHHSALGDDDAVLLGIRSVSQLEENMRWIKAGSLPDGVLTLVDELWEKLRESRSHFV